MEKKRNIGIALLVTAGLLIIFTGVVYAGALGQRRTPIFQNDPQDSATDFYGPMMGQRDVWSDEGDDYPPMMEAMIEAISEATGLSVDEIEARLVNGEHLYTIVTGAGMTEEELDALMDGVHRAYYEQNRAPWGAESRSEWMFDHMQEEWEEHGFGRYRQDYERRPVDEDGFGQPFGGCW
jgi:hypothetical protein